MLVASRKNDHQIAVLALILSPRTVPNVSVYGLDHHFLDQWLDVGRCYLIFLHLVVSVTRSVWWFKRGDLVFCTCPMLCFCICHNLEGEI